MTPTAPGESIRPVTWEDFVGQEALKRELKVRINSALLRERPLEHVLLTGPPGFGKTTLARILARELKDPFESVTMPVTESTLASLVRQFDGVLLLDEVHRAPTKQQESLLPLLEGGYLQTAQARRIEAAWLTIVGATTEPQKIIAPLYDRFPIKPEFDAYSEEEMGDIVMGMAGRTGIDMSANTAIDLGNAAAGTPRNARTLVLAARDLGVTLGRHPTADEVLSLCRVDETGLSVQLVRYIKTLRSLGGQAGLKTLSTMLRLNDSVVQNHERLLLSHGLIEFTDRGRVLTRAGFALAQKDQAEKEEATSG